MWKLALENKHKTPLNLLLKKSNYSSLRVGQLKTAQQIDREKRSRYSLEAHVQDEGQSDWECTSIIEVLLSDVNDNAPEFAQELYSVDIPEDSDVGTLITKVHATDKDIGKFYIFV